VHGDHFNRNAELSRISLPAVETIPQDLLVRTPAGVEARIQKRQRRMNPDRVTSREQFGLQLLGLQPIMIAIFFFRHRNGERRGGKKTLRCHGGEAAALLTAIFLLQERCWIGGASKAGVFAVTLAQPGTSDFARAQA
jgi:hypothetical protein